MSLAPPSQVGDMRSARNPTSRGWGYMLGADTRCSLVRISYIRGYATFLSRRRDGVIDIHVGKGWVAPC